MLIGPLLLALRHARHGAGRSLLLLLCIAAAAFLPMITHVTTRDFEQRLSRRAASTPLVIGARGSRFDLTLQALYFRESRAPAISMEDWRKVLDSGAGTAIPMNVRFTARGFPIVATTPEYAQMRRLRVGWGRLPVGLGECAVGSLVAKQLGISSGDSLFSDQPDSFDIVTPPSLKMRVVGVLKPAGTPDDFAVFTYIATAWVLEGLSHAHTPPAVIPPGLLLDSSEQHLVISEALVDENEARPDNLTTFHLHSSQQELPLSAIIVVPRSDKDETLLRARVDSDPRLQAVAPEAVIRELLGFVVRIRALLDMISALLIVVTGILLALVMALSARVRAREVATLFRIGASRATVLAMFAWEWAMLLAAGILLAAVLAAFAPLLLPDAVKLM